MSPDGTDRKKHQREMMQRYGSAGAQAGADRRQRVPPVRVSLDHAGRDEGAQHTANGVAVRPKLVVLT
jgi:hypothetical protein